MYYNKPPPPLPSQPRTYVNYTNPATVSTPDDRHQAFFHPQNRSNTAPGALYSYHTPPVVPSPPPPPLPPLPPSLMPGGPARHAQNAQDHLQFYQRTQSSPGPSYDLSTKPRRPSVPTPPFIHQPDYFSSQHNATAYKHPPALPPKIPVAMYPNVVLSASTPPPLPPLPPKLPQTRYNRPAPLPTSLSEQWHTDGMPGTRTPLGDDMTPASFTAPDGPRGLSQEEEEEEEDEEFVRALQESLNVSKRQSQWEPYDPQKFESDEILSRPPQSLSVSIPVAPSRPLESTNDTNSSSGQQYTPTRSWLSLEDSADDDDLAAQQLQDEQLARQLAEEEEEEQPDDLNLSSDNREIVREEDSGIRLPAYDDAVPSTQRTESPRHPPRSFADLQPVLSPEPVQGRNGPPQRILVGNSNDAPLATHRPALVSEASPPRPRSTNPPPESQVESRIIPPGQDTSPGDGLESSEESSNPASSSTSSRNPVGAVAEDELLLGVSFGFNAPVIKAQLLPLQGPIPNIIALPYGKFPPMHIQAPSWRQLLKLMARLSGSRIEPSIEAMAVNKSEMKLRTVVQFVRVHHSSMEWRCILYLSIDYPIPPNAPNQFKYTNGDVSTLPWSYTLLPLPELLCDGPDSHMAKYYNIPVTTTTPLPSVPINLPNLAMYLQSALDDSRRALNDSSSGLRKLAKMVDGFYPSDQPISVLEADDFGDRSLLRRGVKKVFGKANKSTNARGRGGNADTYELVTPFRLDDWG